MAPEQTQQLPNWAPPTEPSNEGIPIATPPCLLHHPLGKPSLPNLYRSQHVAQPAVEDTSFVPIKPIRKMRKSSNLSLNLPAMSRERTKSSGALRSPSLSPSFNSQYSPASPGRDHGTSEGVFYDAPQSPITALPQPRPNSPKGQERAKGIFSGSKFSRSQSRSGTESPSQHPSDALPAKGAVYQHGRSRGSTPELSLYAAEASSTSDPSSPRFDNSVQPQLPPKDPVKSHSDPHLLSGPFQLNADPRAMRAEKQKQLKFGHMINRTKSVSREESPMSKPSFLEEDPAGRTLPPDQTGLRTAPLEMKAQDKTFREMISSKRNRSADRAPPPPRNLPRPSNEAIRTPSKERRNQIHDREKDQPIQFFQNIRNSKNKASDLGKAGKGFFGKLTRSGSSHDRDAGNDHEIDITKYQPTIIRWGIVEQTRATRISTRLEQSRDKTEFWLPALPWRCIDYLNLKGTEVEGLYRVSGSVRELKYWQRRFDTERDIDLLSQENLFDVNVVASMLKDWLRNIPDEIFPKHIQAEIQRQCPDAANLERCPKVMQEQLSKLPPFNYYLLFAITCHLSLLTSCYDKTKMDFENLCVCIQPSLNLDRFIFKILIKDWRNCWQGCLSEKEYLARENEFLSQSNASQSSVSIAQSDAASSALAGRSSRAGHDSSSTTNESRTLSSADSHNPSMTEASTPDDRPPRPDRDTKDTIRPIYHRDNDLTPRQSRARSPSQSRSRERSRERLEQISTDLPELSPLKPLSPLNLT